MNFRLTGQIEQMYSFARSNAGEIKYRQAVKMGSVPRRAKMKLSFAACFVVLAFTTPQGSFAQARGTSSFRAGAAKVDVTPAERDLPKTYEGILDRIYS